MTDLILILLGWIALAAGLTVLVVTLIKKLARRRGLSAELIAQLIMPEYERRARMYCRIYGFPESEWDRFASRAIGEIIMSARH